MSLILDGTNGLSDVDGSAATPAIRGTDANTGIFFPAADTIAFAEGGTESMRLNSSGQVGIGKVPSTGRTLEIATATDYTNIVLQNTSTGSGSTDGFLLEAGGSDALLVNYEVGNMRFFTSATERMRIDSSGNLLIGTTSAIGKLGVSGSGAIATFNQTAVGNYCITTNPFNNAGIYYHNAFNIGGTGVGSITSSGSSTTFATSSDYRLKENIAPMTGALNKVSSLKPCTYTWKVDGSAGQGFIAHELAEVVPDAVIGKKDAVDEENKPVYQGIDTSFLVATLTAAIQELKAELDSVKAELATLKA